MAKASKKPTPKSKYHKKIKIEGTPDEILKKMLSASLKKGKNK